MKEAWVWLRPHCWWEFTPWQSCVCPSVWRVSPLFKRAWIAVIATLTDMNLMRQSGIVMGSRGVTGGRAVNGNLSPTFAHPTVKFAHQKPPAYHPSLPECVHDVAREIMHNDYTCIVAHHSSLLSCGVSLCALSVCPIIFMICHWLPVTSRYNYCKIVIGWCWMF